MSTSLKRVFVILLIGSITEKAEGVALTSTISSYNTVQNNDSTLANDSTTIQNNSSTLQNDSTIQNNSSTLQSDSTTIQNSSIFQNDSTTIQNSSSTLANDSTTLQKNSSTLQNDNTTIQNSSSTLQNDSTFQNNSSTIQDETTTIQHSNSALDTSRTTIENNNSTIWSISSTLMNLTPPTTPSTEGLRIRLSRSTGFQAQDQKETVKDVLRKYHDCVKHRADNWNKIEAMVYMEGKDVTLSCNLCIHPDHDKDRYLIVWRRYRQQVGEDSPVPPDPKRFIVKKNNDLFIKSIDVADAGQYSCTRSNGEHEKTYQVDVVFQLKMRVLREDNGYTPSPPIRFTSFNLMMFTTWSEWSDCDLCGDHGVRQRIGLCTLAKINPAQPVNPVDIPNIDGYDGGLPCHSTALPEYFANYVTIRDRKDEIMNVGCIVPCPTASDYRQVVDKNGNLVKHLEVHYYSMDEVPHLPALTKRDVIYKDADQRFILKCPYESEAKKSVMIRWQKGSKVLYNWSLRKTTRNRIRIDNLYRILFARLKLSDTGAYNCWDGPTLVAVIKLIVTEPFNKDIKTYISLAGCVITVVVVVLIAFNLCCKKRQKTAQ